jgi:hypothetical protein
MIRNEPAGRMVGREVGLHRAWSPAAGPRLWQAVAGAWRRVREAWLRSPMEDELEREVRRYLARKPLEPGDVIIVNRMVEEFSRRYAG